MTPFNLNCLLIGPIVMYTHTGRWGSNLTYEFGGDTIQSEAHIH